MKYTVILFLKIIVNVKITSDVVKLVQLTMQNQFVCLRSNDYQLWVFIKISAFNSAFHFGENEEPPFVDLFYILLPIVHFGGNGQRL